MHSAAVGIHWWTFSTSVEAEAVLDVLDGSHSEVEYVGGFGHPQHVVHETGAKVYFGSKRKEQPVVVNAGGEVCERASADLVAWADALGGRVTRCDVAADVEPADLARRRLVQMHRAWVRGKVETRMSPESHDLYKSEAADGGMTAYFGGKSSKLRLRAYDRRGPLRLEWQWRPDAQVGRTIPGMILKAGVASVWRGLAHSAVFPLPWYRELLEGEAVTWKYAQAEENTFLKAVEYIREQLGASLWALRMIGLTLDDLAVPPERPRGRIIEKFTRWAEDADRFAYECAQAAEREGLEVPTVGVWSGDRLRRELQCRSKSKRG